MNIKPIKTEADYQAALSAMESLWNAPPGSTDSERLEVLSILVEAFENDHFPIAAPSPIEAILFRMEQEGLTRKALEPLIGSRGRVAEVLNGQRKLSIDMIKNLHSGLRIPLESLIIVREPSGRITNKKRALARNLKARAAKKAAHGAVRRVVVRRVASR